MHSKWLCALVMTCLGMADPASALTVEKTVTVAVAPVKAWDAIKDLCGIAKWHPSVVSCQLSQVDGVIRETIALDPSGTIVDKFIRRDVKRMAVTYGLISSPLPVQDYISTISVTPQGKGTRIRWVGTFNPQKGIPDDDATSWVSDIYEDGLKALSKSLEEPKTAAR